MGRKRGGVEQVEAAVLRIQVTHQPDHVKGGGAHLLANDPLAVFPTQRGLEKAEFGDEVVMVKHLAIAATHGDESGHVKPAFDRLVTHAVRAEEPVEHRANFAVGQTVGLLGEAGPALDEEHQADELHAKALVVIDHKMIGLDEEVGDATLNQPGDDALGELTILGRKPTVEVVVIE